MRKLMFILALLIATPAFAALTVDCNVQPDCNYVNIEYKGADPCERPRAFALVVTTTNGAMITDVINYKANGESSSSSRGFGIYPSGIEVNVAGDVNSWGNPKADPCDPGDSVDPPSTKVILELGSLYYGDSNAPVVWSVTSGLLCTVQLDANGAGDTTIAVTDEDQYRGGVVLESGNSVSVDASVLNECWGVEQEPNCFEGHPDQYVWRDWYEPNCWCHPTQCRGNADGDYQGSSRTGYYWVFTEDYNILAKAWKITEPNLPYYAGNEDPDWPNGIVDVNYWTSKGKDAKGICADFDHKYQGSSRTGYFRVFTDDYILLADHWKVTEPCLPFYEGNEDPCFPNGIDANCLTIY